MTVRIGIVGAGTIGKVHAAAAAGAGLEIAGIADIREERARQLAARYDGTVPIDHSQKLFRDPTIDAVVIGVPNHCHRDIAIAAMRAGKDVLLEKPMGLHATECQAINDVASSTARLLQIGMVNRFTAVGQAAKKMIVDGDMGTIYHAKAHLYRRRGVPGLGGWFTTKEQSGGGPLIDIGVHVVDLAYWLMNFPKPARVSGKVYAYFGKRMKDYVYERMWAGPPNLDGICDVEDSAHALICFDGGASLDLNVSWAINMPKADIRGDGMMGFFGDQAGMSFELEGDHVTMATELLGHNADMDVMLPQVDPFQEQITAFARSVETREPPCATGGQAQIVQSILDAIYKSSETDREVVFDV